MKSVTRAILIGFSALLVASLARSANEAAHSTEAGAWLQNYLSGFASFQADFRQRSSNASGDRAQESSGTLYLQKPGRFRWDYREPTHQLIVSDGAKIWLYDVDLEQVTVKAVDDSLSTTPALLLAGKSSITDSFDVTRIGSREGIDWLQLVPRRNDTDFVEMRLGFGNGELKLMELKDKLQQSTRIEFSAIRRNPRLAGDLFTFVPPPGVDVIGAPHG